VVETTYSSPLKGGSLIRYSWIWLIVLHLNVEMERRVNRCYEYFTYVEVTRQSSFGRPIERDELEVRFEEAVEKRLPTQNYNPDWSCQRVSRGGGADRADLRCQSGKYG
jgi:hypothetical protein